MAKQLVNPIERHLEKAVLGVAGLVLVVVVGKYAVSSSNQLEIGGKLVSPKDIDSVLAQKAATVRDRIFRAPPDEEMPEALYDTFVEELDPYRRAELPRSLPAAVAIGPTVQLVDAAEGGWGRTELVAVAPTETPTATHGRSTFLLETESRDLHRPANWVTVSVVFDVKGQMARQRRTYGATLKEVAFGRPQLQRRARHVDGSWSDADWENVVPWSWLAPEMPSEPEIALLADGDEVVVVSRVLDEVERFFDELGAPLLQLALLRPVLPPVVNGDQWDFPYITSRRDVLDQDDYYLNSEQRPATDPVDRYRDEAAAVPAAEVLTDAERIAWTFQEIEQLLNSARENLSSNHAIRAHNLAFDLSRDESASRNDRTKAAQKMQEANETEIDIDRIKRSGRGPTRAPAPKDDEEFTREPPAAEQMWVHDVRPGTDEDREAVQSGVTYQYRIRPVITNRLAGRPEKLQNPEDATALFIPGEWTEPVEVTIKHDSRFFVASKDPRNKEVGIEFFRWFEGNWFRSRRTKFKTGAPLQDSQRVEVPGFLDQEKTERANVDFEADATVVDIDFERTYRERRKGSSRTGVKFGPPTSACCVTLVDSQGRLVERFVPTDKGHPEKRAIGLWKPRKD